MDIKGQSFLIFSISDEEGSGDVEPNFMLVCEDSPQRNKKPEKFGGEKVLKMTMLRVKKDCEGLNLKLCWVLLNFFNVLLNLKFHIRSRH